MNSQDHVNIMVDHFMSPFDGYRVIIKYPDSRQDVDTHLPTIGNAMILVVTLINEETDGNPISSIEIISNNHLD